MEGDRSSTLLLLRSEIAVIEEWNGSASSKLMKTATFTVVGDTVRASGNPPSVSINFHGESSMLLFPRDVDGPCFPSVPFGFCIYCMLR
ncbi:hypothetical protein ACS0TY_022039 [Phlomoides rotata]